MTKGLSPNVTGMADVADFIVKRLASVVYYVHRGPDRNNIIIHTGGTKKIVLTIDIQEA